MGDDRTYWRPFEHSDVELLGMHIPVSKGIISSLSPDCHEAAKQLAALLREVFINALHNSLQELPNDVYPGGIEHDGS